MYTYNQNNVVTLNGRLTADPRQWVNDNTVHTVFSVATQNAFTSKDGTRGVEFVEVHDFAKADRPSKVLELIHKGDAVTVTGTLILNEYKGKRDLQVRLVALTMNETKSVTDARLKAREERGEKGENAPEVPAAVDEIIEGIETVDLEAVLGV